MGYTLGNSLVSCGAAVLCARRAYRTTVLQLEAVPISLLTEYVLLRCVLVAVALQGRLKAWAGGVIARAADWTVPPLIVSR
jgi:hypothetical protein